MHLVRAKYKLFSDGYGNKQIYGAHLFTTNDFQTSHPVGGGHTKIPHGRHTPLISIFYCSYMIKKLLK
jgi:hypothetical protein